jgi:hypothetical protein
MKLSAHHAPTVPHHLLACDLPGFYGSITSFCQKTFSKDETILWLCYTKDQVSKVWSTVSIILIIM